jgi:hypothetical protein
VTLFGLALLAVLAVTSGLLTAAMFPEKTVSEDFIYFGRRDLPVVARGLGAIMVGVLVGALIGRVLPAVLAAALIIGLAFLGLSLAEDRWNRSEASVQRFNFDPNQVHDMTALDVDYGLELPNGQFLSYSEAFDRGMSPSYTDERGRAFESEADLLAGDRVIGYDARLTIPGERYRDIVLRHSALAAALGVLALGLAALVVVRRRPV